jgi:nucleoside-diphosphate-sugar epimerase
MIVNALAGRPTHFAWGADQRRPYVHVDDVVRGVIAAAKAERIGQPAYNVAGPDFPAYPRIAEIVAELIPGAEITFELGMQPGGTKRDQMDLAAAERDLGYVPTVTIEEGVRSYVEALRAGRDGP